MWEPIETYEKHLLLFINGDNLGMIRPTNKPYTTQIRNLIHPPSCLNTPLLPFLRWYGLQPTDFHTSFPYDAAMDWFSHFPSHTNKTWLLGYIYLQIDIPWFTFTWIYCVIVHWVDAWMCSSGVLSCSLKSQILIFHWVDGWVSLIAVSSACPPRWTCRTWWDAPSPWRTAGVAGHSQLPRTCSGERLGCPPVLIQASYCHLKKYKN